jgi:uncharacterized membrane protein
MAFCANCGAQGEGRFCPKCGSPLAADAGITPGPAVPLQSAGMTDNMAAALCYILGILTGILFLVLEPYNKNKTIRFHAFQSIFFWVAAVALSIVGSIITLAFIAVPFVGALVGLLFHTILYLGILVVWVLLMYKAYNNEKLVLPIIGPLAEKQA